MILASRENYHWTDHVKRKIRQYGLSESRIKRVLRHPNRVEIGVAEDTMAGMQPAGSKKHPFEIWVMWAQKRKGKKEKKSPHPNPLFEKERGQKGINFTFDDKVVIISAWRYPGISPLREPPPIPDDVWEELQKIKRKRIVA